VESSATGDPPAVEETLEDVIDAPEDGMSNADKFETEKAVTSAHTAVVAAVLRTLILVMGIPWF
jgi:hypothetical protein